MPSVSNVLRRLIVQNLALFRFCLLRDATVIALRSLRCVFFLRVCFALIFVATSIVYEFVCVLINVQKLAENYIC